MEGWLFAREIVIREIILEGDSLVVANSIAGRSPEPSSIALIVYGITSLSHEFRGFQVSHTRIGNQPAHSLAKHA